MMYRLLMRLAGQLIEERTARRRSPAARRGTGAGPARWFRRDGFSRAAMLLAAVGAGTALALLTAARPGEHVADGRSRGSATAALSLNVAASPAWPAVVYLEGPGLADSRPTPDASQTYGVESVGNAFVPRFQVVPQGALLTMVNGDPFVHNTHVSRRGDTTFNVALPVAGVPVAKALAGTGVYSVRCDLHPWMQGWLFAPPSRYFRVLARPGTVSFDDIPPGNYVLRTWRADNFEHARALTLAAGESVTLHMQPLGASD